MYPCHVITDIIWIRSPAVIIVPNRTLIIVNKVIRFDLFARKCFSSFYGCIICSFHSVPMWEVFNNQLIFAAMYEIVLFRKVFFVYLCDLCGYLNLCIYVIIVSQNSKVR